eukprot:3619845-Ditylum_brightwellii.AAC.2
MALTQHSLEAGLCKFKDKGAEAVVNELKQLHDMGTFEPKNINTLTDKEKENTLESLVFINEKQNSRIKCRACASGSKQRGWYTKEEAASPTVASELVLLAGVIDVREG